MAVEIHLDASAGLGAWVKYAADRQEILYNAVEYRIFPPNAPDTLNGLCRGYLGDGLRETVLFQHAAEEAAAKGLTDLLRAAGEAHSQLLAMTFAYSQQEATRADVDAVDGKAHAALKPLMRWLKPAWRLKNANIELTRPLTKAQAAKFHNNGVTVNNPTTYFANLIFNHMITSPVGRGRLWQFNIQDFPNRFCDQLR